MNNKVLLGMSGGVDSSVSAIILKEKGYEVIGASLELLNNSDNANTFGDVKNLCDELNIDYYVFDYVNEFKKNVIDNFITCYANCKTPNPCIECNKHMKFGAMWEKAIELGCQHIATGHYAKIEYSKEYKRWVLKKSKNISKDQSYVLWSVPKEILEHIIFPLADFFSTPLL